MQSEGVPSHPPEHHPERPLEKPASVKWGVSLLYLSILIGILTEIGTTVWSIYHGVTGTSASLIIGIIIWLVFLFLAYKIAKGTNWARIVMLVLVIVTIIMRLI